MSDERKCPHCGVRQFDDNPCADPALASMANLCWKCVRPLKVECCISQHPERRES